MRYIDTSIVVAVLVPEHQSAQATKWLAMRAPASLALSSWVTAELSSALARKVRMDRLSERDRDKALIEYNTGLLPSLTAFPIEAAHFSAAAQICDRHTAAIRAPDALHLAVASSYGVTLCTLDQRFAAGATAIGYDVELIA